MREDRIFHVLPRSVRVLLREEGLVMPKLQEIKLRTGKPLLYTYDNEEVFAGETRGKSYMVTKEDVREMLDYISNYSLYAYEQEMKQGYITVEGGHRIGMAGQVIIEGGKVKNLRHVASINVRMSHEIKGCADRIFPYITKMKNLCHTLILSPPGCGKTTLLRDIIRQVSDGNAYVKGRTVGVVDERSEIGGCYRGVPQNHLGIRTDVLDACPKAEGMIMLIRSMGPEVIAVDEIGGEEDVSAIEYAMHCGCKMLATAHGRDMDELRKKPLFEKMIREKRFERYILLGNEKEIGGICGIYNEDGLPVTMGGNVC